ncbi:FecR domain-containing protein [Flammeovirgaceae bacterium SG7u.111]|nr:FecR domain-containing protein [Flammeovirgaceae bacterium SG7u.132]WPO36831.1 FecR domain-containing protein [Flammeovirgaceae bacterium SG7u.111]
MKKRLHTLNDLILDQQFIDWVKRPTPESDRYWNDWIAQYPESVPTITKAKLLVSELDEKTLGTRIELIEKVKTNIDSYILEHSQATSQKNSIKLWYAIAASISIIMIAGWITWQKFGLTSDTNQEITGSIAYLEKFTSKGQKLSLKLQDGTVIKLNSNSKLKFPENFNAHSTREVYLTGEAYFDVERDTTKPFIIHTGDLKTTVLGTSFNIMSYPSESKVKIAVESGRVGVKDTKTIGEEVVLSPTQMLVFDKEKSNSKIEEFDHSSIFGWKDGNLVFHKSSPDDVVSGLEKWYGVKIILKKDLKSKEGFSGTFQDQPLSNVLEGISFSLKFNYEMNADTVLIY